MEARDTKLKTVDCSKITLESNNRSFPQNQTISQTVNSPLNIHRCYKLSEAVR